MYRQAIINLRTALLFLITITVLILLSAAAAGAQETGGDLGGGAGIFRPRNPESKRSANPSRPRPARPSAAEIEEKFDDAVSDGNDARDARKFAAAEASYRAALRLKPRDARAYYALGNVFVDQQRWDDAEKAYRTAYEITPNDSDALMALSFALVQPQTGAINAKRFADAEYFARRATQLAPTNAIAWDRLGVALTARGIYNADAEGAFRRATELDPNFVVAQVHLAGVLRHLKRWNEAEPIYRAAIDQAKHAPTLV